MISCVLEEPYSGAWVADTVDTSAYSGTIALEASSWIGAAVSSAVDGGRIYSRIVAGKGRLGTVLPDRWYNGTELSDTIASDMIAEAGEVLGYSSLGLRVDSWQRKRGTLGECLSELVAITGGSWWVARDGSINLGSRSSAVLVPGQFSRASVDVDGSVLVNTISKTDINPGDTWEGKTIRHIRWTLSPDNLTAALAFYDLPSPALSLDYLRTYSAKVDRQNGDGTLDVIVNQAFAVSSVQWLSGIPANVTILPGDTVTLGWLGGNPQRPYAALVAQTSDSRPVARVGDTVDCGWLVVPAQGTGVGTVALPPILYFPPGPTAQAQAALVAVAPLYVPTPINLQGTITSGSERVRL